MPTKRRKPYKAYDDPSFNKIALVIGHICIHWARIEDIIDSFIELAVPLEEKDISRAITNNMDVRSKIQTLKAIAFQKKVSEEWFEDLLKLLDYVDNKLRPERNQYVHSHWFVPKGRLVRVSRKVKFKKPQAFRMTLSTEETFPVKIKEARKFCTELGRVWMELFQCYFEFFWSPLNVAYAPSEAKTDNQPTGQKKLGPRQQAARMKQSEIRG